MANEVEIVVKSTDRTDLNAIGNRLRSTMASSARDSVKDVDKEFSSGFKDVGEHSGQSFEKALDEHIRVWSQHVTEEVDVKVKEKFKETGDHAGRSMASGLEGSVGRLGSKIGTDVGTKIGTNLGKSVGESGASAGGAGMAVIGTLLVGLAPGIGALAASALVLAFGAGLAGLGLAATFHLKAVQKELKSFQKFASSWAKDISKPFEGVWKNLFNQAGQVMKVFQGPLKSAMSKFIAPALNRFIGNLAEGFTKLAPAIGPMSKAFADLMDAIGPQMPQLFQQIATALISLSKTVSDNSQLFGDLAVDLLQLIPLGLRFVNFLAKSFSWLNAHRKGLTDLVGAFQTIVNPIAGAVAAFTHLSTIVSKAKAALAAFKNTRVGKITLAVVDKVSSAVRTAIGWVKKLVGKTVHIAVTGSAAAASAVRSVINTIHRFIGKVVHIGVSGVQGAINLVRNLIDIIHRLVGKVVHVGASVSGIGAVRSLIGAISGVVSKTVNIVAHKIGFAHGGVVGTAATGGVRSNTVMVGENGPELVDLAPGSRVRSNSDSRAALAGSGGQVTVQLEVVGGGKDEFTRAMVYLLRHFIRATAGSGPNSVQKALGGI